MMRTSDFDYHLPTELIAQTPIEPRDASRLLVLDRATGRMEHRYFYEILDYLRPGDLTVFNQSRVIPARLYGRRQDSGGRVELLLLRREGDGVWQALGKPGRRLRPGVTLVMGPAREIPSSPLFEGKSPHTPFLKGGERDLKIEVEVLESAAEGIKRVRLSTEEGIDRLGEVPLPPYIHQKLADPERYQTVYARQPGSVAAPTAGLHFTDSLLERIRHASVELAFVTLHVGLDTFRPVQDDDPTRHHIHTEYYEVTADTAAALNRARQEGRRIIAVGTTSVRVLEQLGQDIARAGHTQLTPATGQADLFILPGHQFRVVDAMVTNFHLPRSTLLMLVSAFSGRELVLRAYQEAIDQRYRFYSFGDAMLIV
jgi:S-adenosylmethionine:tRNA ribosyltransferase-isomerase